MRIDPDVAHDLREQARIQKISLSTHLERQLAEIQRVKALEAEIAEQGRQIAELTRQLTAAKGRPPSLDKRVAIGMSLEEHERLGAAAHQAGMTRAAYLRQCIAQTPAAAALTKTKPNAPPRLPGPAKS